MRRRLKRKKKKGRKDESWERRGTWEKAALTHLALNCFPVGIYRISVIFFILLKFQSTCQHTEMGIEI